MDVETASPDAGGFATTPLTEAVTTGIATDDGDLAALIGGGVAGVLLLLVCVTAALLWCLSRQKGSYITNEMDDTDDVDDEPLTVREDE